MAMRLLILAAIFSAADLRAQDPNELKPRPEGNTKNAAGGMRDGRTQVLKGTAEKQNLEALDIWAENLVYRVTQQKYYYPKDMTDKGELVPIEEKDTVQVLMKELDEFIVKPSIADMASKSNDGMKPFYQAEYIIKFGESLDKAIRKVLEDPNQPRHVKLNAARMLAIAAKSGSPAHAETILGLLAKPKAGGKGEEFNDGTPLEVLAYAIQAAGNLLSAYNLNKRDTNDLHFHTVDSPILARLARALEQIVQKRTPYNKGVAAPEAGGVLTTPAAADPKKAKDPKENSDKTVAANTTAKAVVDPEQAVIRYYRRLAVRALAEFRFPSIVDRDDTIVRPAQTLAKVALMDPSFKPAIGPDEVAEAVRGLSNLSTFKDLDYDALLTCIAAGFINLNTAFKDNNLDRTSGNLLPWQVVGARLNVTFANWLAIAQTNSTMSTAKASIEDLVGLVQRTITKPLEQSGRTATIEANEIQNWLKNRKKTGFVLYRNIPESQKAAWVLNVNEN